LNDIRIITKPGGTIDDSEMVDGIVFDQKAAKAAGGPSRMEKAKVMTAGQEKSAFHLFLLFVFLESFIGFLIKLDLLCDVTNITVLDPARLV